MVNQDKRGNSRASCAPWGARRAPDIMAMNADGTLIERLRRGEPATFEALAAEHSESVLRLARLLLNDPHEATDILQESMLRFARAAADGRFREENGSIGGYIKATARNLCVNRLKRRSVLLLSGDGAEVWEHIPSGEPGPDGALDERRFCERFEEALDHLTPLQRTVFVLREVNGDRCGEIAAALGTSVNAVAANLCRARRRLRRLLAPYEGIRHE